MTRTLVALATLLATALPGGAADRVRVVATTADLGALATAVGSDALEVTVLARPTEDPHFVDARPSFIRTLNQADALIEGGAALEAGWLPPLLDGARNPRIAPGAPGRIVASTGIALRDVPTQLDRSLGDVHPFGNPHYLLDPLNAKIAARTIADGLCAIDGARCATYRGGAERFGAIVGEKLIGWQRALAPARGVRVLTYHRDFDYFADRFGLEVLATLEPKPGVPPSPTHLTALVPRAQTAGVRLILIEPYRDRRSADLVAGKIGARVLLVPIVPDGRDTTDYVGTIDAAVRQIAGALGP